MVESESRGHVPLRQKALPSFGDVKPLAETAAWSGVNLIISSLLLGGGLGYLLDRALGTSFIVAIGLILGMALALVVGWFRYGSGRDIAEGAAATGVAPVRSSSSTELSTEGQG